MSKAKIAITLDERLLYRLDILVREARFPNRSQAIEAALAEKLDRIGQTRLATECLKLNVEEERALSEEGISTGLDEWPEY